MVRRSSTETFQRIEHLRDQITLHTGDLLDQRSLVDVLRDAEPHEIYNLAAMSFVAASWNQPVLTAEFTGVGRHAHARGDARGRAADRASTRRPRRRCSARCWRSRRPRRRRSTRAAPTAWRRPTATSSRSTTARATTCSPARGSFSTTRSERRGLEFVTRKVTHGVAAIKLGLQDELLLGNLDAERDWGYAKDYVEAMWLMLQQDEPDDYVIATGETHSVRELVGPGVRATSGWTRTQYVADRPALPSARPRSTT